MITFKFKSPRDSHIGLDAITGLVRDKAYKDTMIGPYDAYSLITFGVIIDGEEEEKLAEAFKEKLDGGKIFYDRVDELGKTFYKDRRW